MKSNIIRKVLTSSVFAAAVLSLNIANAQSLPPGVQDVVKMKQAGLSDDVILAQVKSSGASYNLTVDQLIALKQAGVSGPIITALMSGNGSTAAAPAPAPMVAAPPVAPPTTPAPAPVPTAAPMATAAPAPTEPPPGAPDAASAGPAPSIDAFQAQLSPYGNWVQVPGYGLCWQPAVAMSDPVWRPYLDSGHWIYTDAGWSWQSDYPWGNVAFHYGRWTRVAGIWTWVPGYDYAPAWVSWRDVDGYSGWAPLPPEAVFRPGLGLYYHGALAVDVDFGLGAADFTFVPYDHFWDYHLRTYYVPHDRVVLFFGRSRIMNGYRVDHGHFVVEGPGHDHIFAVTHHDVRVVRDVHARVDVHDGHDGHDNHDGHGQPNHGW